MKNSGALLRNEVKKTTYRSIEWKVKGLEPYQNCMSPVFSMSTWDWYLVVDNSTISSVTLNPKSRDLSTPGPPIVSLIMHLTRGSSEPVHREIVDTEIRYQVGHVWRFSRESSLHGNFVIRIKFLDLKVPPDELPFGLGSEPYSIWEEEPEEEPSIPWSTCSEQATENHSAALASLGRMLSESIYTDITIATPDGSIGAHRAVLAANSPVFKIMFSGDYKEAVSSVINIPDMSFGACKAMLDFIYGKREAEQFEDHMMELIAAADKYDIKELKRVCEASLVQDINAGNVFKRLHYADTYRFPNLKASCLHYLVKSRGIYEVGGDTIKSHLQHLGTDLTVEMILAILDEWKASEDKAIMPVVPAFATALANLSPDEQRRKLGEYLYPLVDNLEHEHAAKVTSMLLQMDQTEILHLLESPEALKAKVAEARDISMTMRRRNIPGVPH